MDKGSNTRGCTWELYNTNFFRKRNALKFFSTTEGCSVQGHVIPGTCAERLLLWQSKAVTNLANLSRSVSLRICLPWTKRLGLLSDGELLPHDKAQPHTTQQPCNLLQNFSSRTLNTPPHRLDSTPSSCSHALKKHLSGHCSTRDEDVQYAVTARRELRMGLLGPAWCRLFSVILLHFLLYMFRM